jgi:hypothetical protein
LSYKRQAASGANQLNGPQNGLWLGFPTIPMFVGISIAGAQVHQKLELFRLFPTRKIFQKVALQTPFCCTSASTDL